MIKRFYIPRSIALLLFVSLFFVKCGDNLDCCTIIDTQVRIHYVNPNGDNLFHTDGNFSEDQLKIYYKEGEEYKYVYNANLDAPNMHTFDTDGNGRLILTVFPSEIFEGNQSTTLIELNDDITDTLICAFDLSNDNVIWQKGWLNGKEIENRFMTVTK